MFGWDQRAAVIRRDIAMARVAKIPDTAWMVCHAAKLVELQRFEDRKQEMLKELQMETVIWRLSVLCSSTAAEVETHNRAMAIVSSDSHMHMALLSIDFCKRMLAIEAIWGPEPDHETENTAQSSDDNVQDTGKCKTTLQIGEFRWLD